MKNKNQSGNKKRKIAVSQKLVEEPARRSARLSKEAREDFLALLADMREHRNSTDLFDRKSFFAPVPVLVGQGVENQSFPGAALSQLDV